MRILPQENTIFAHKQFLKWLQPEATSHEIENWRKKSHNQRWRVFLSCKTFLPPRVFCTGATNWATRRCKIKIFLVRAYFVQICSLMPSRTNKLRGSEQGQTMFNNLFPVIVSYENMTFKVRILPPFDQQMESL